MSNRVHTPWLFRWISLRCGKLGRNHRPAVVDDQKCADNLTSFDTWWSGVINVSHRIWNYNHEQVSRTDLLLSFTEDIFIRIQCLQDLIS